ncbi:hypothetical protein CCUS01_00547 [Colletotrichum cuscutae]|uniref:Uncharacterized protein n=1 Tax=Colletotrichum cuscutae TaxID=1209917 RepID=A0AAI9VAL1_9PEZI|nr:hypothetical protein CCUS01_00547 [Colletotrichum cuscutae]
MSIAGLTGPRNLSTIAPVIFMPTSFTIADIYPFKMAFGKTTRASLASISRQSLPFWSIYDTGSLQAVKQVLPSNSNIDKIETVVGSVRRIQPQNCKSRKPGSRGNGSCFLSKSCRIQIYMKNTLSRFYNGVLNPDLQHGTLTSHLTIRSLVKFHGYTVVNRGLSGSFNTKYGSLRNAGYTQYDFYRGENRSFTAWVIQYAIWGTKMDRLLSIAKGPRRGIWQFLPTPDRFNVLESANFVIACVALVFSIVGFVLGLVSIIYAKLSYQIGLESIDISKVSLDAAVPFVTQLLPDFYALTEVRKTHEV